MSRELKARYRGSVLGFFWSFANPLLLLLVYTFVFSYVMRPPEGIHDYALFLVIAFAGTVNPSAGPLPVEVKWEVNDTSVTIGGNRCTTTNGNKCKGTFGTVQRTFSASAARSGPLKIVQVWEGGSGDVGSFQQGTTHDLVVKIAVAGNLAVAQSVSDPAVLIRVTGSQNQSVDCDPALPNLL